MTQAEKEEFGLLVKLNMKRAYFSAMGFLGSHDEAMDASQEAFIKAYNSFSGFDRTKKFFTWYYKILKNHCLNVLRDSSKTTSFDFLEYSESGEPAIDYTDKLEKAELIDKVQCALQKLAPEEKEIIILKEFENLSYKEIAETLEIPEGTVMSRLFYARKKLSCKLKEEI